MSRSDFIEQELSDWFDRQAPARAPDDFVASLMVDVGVATQRPAWMPPMGGQGLLRLSPAAMLLIALLLLGGLFVGAVALTQRPAPHPSGPTLITFAAFVGADGLPAGAGSDREIFVANPDGSGIRRLTHSAGSKSNPVWSPDGLQIAYALEDQSYVGAPGWLEVASVATGQSRRVAHLDTTKLFDNFTLAWAPDSMRIAFSDPSGLHEVRLADSTLWPETLATHAYWPSWSPDGRILAYTRSDGLWVVGPDNNRRLIHHDDATYRPIWLTDDRIAYAGRDGLASISPDGTGRRRITGGVVDPLNWDFSPDRRWVAVVGQTGDLWIMRVDGSESRLLRSGFQGGRPIWSPDGTLIACEQGPQIVFVSAADGSVVDRLSSAGDAGWGNWGLGWSP